MMSTRKGFGYVDELFHVHRDGTMRKQRMFVNENVGLGGFGVDI